MQHGIPKRCAGRLEPQRLSIYIYVCIYRYTHEYEDTYIDVSATAPEEQRACLSSLLSPALSQGLCLDLVQSLGLLLLLVLVGVCLWSGSGLGLGVDWVWDFILGEKKLCFRADAPHFRSHLAH